MKRLRSKLTYGNVVATLALFLVLAGGSAFAASKLAKNSVGTKQIKNNAVTGAKIKDGAVTGSKISLSSLGTVPSATHADSATNATHAASADSATHAASADSATNATNATKLNGQEAATYLGRAAQARAFSPVAITKEIQTNVTPGGALSITVPPGVDNVMAEGTVSFAEPSVPGDTVLWVAESPATCTTETGLGWENRAFGSLSSTNPRDEVTQNILSPVSPGVHTYLLCVYVTDTTTEAFLRELTLQTVAGGPTG
jgi:hypothetical protein